MRAQKQRRPFTWLHLIGLNLALLVLLLQLLPEGHMSRESHARALLTPFGADFQFGDRGEVSAVSCLARPINNWALSILPEFREVESINLWNTRGFDDQGLRHLQGLPRLCELCLVNTPVTDAGMEQIARLTSLRVLILSGTQVTDDGLRQLSSLKQLRRLVLEHTEISDEGLAFLAELPNLEIVVLNRTLVTDQGVLRLKQALSNSVVISA